ncbi:MAG TPA: response regulator [Candidatus Angelobacter sp.]|nr:response regulator [Candidatus Angelobacter sp.]
MIRTILLVEDDKNDVFFLQQAMKTAGALNPIHVASDGQQAIDYLKGAGKFADREKFPVPCLVLLDLKLPYVMGLDVLRWIRKQPGTAFPVVMLSASAEESDIVTAYRLGANAFLTKPSEASKLVETVKAIKDFWLTNNIPPPESHEKEVAAGPTHGSPRETPADARQTTRETFLNVARTVP